jgi:hypothetical protein
MGVQIQKESQGFRRTFRLSWCGDNSFDYEFSRHAAAPR